MQNLLISINSDLCVRDLSCKLYVKVQVSQKDDSSTYPEEKVENKEQVLETHCQPVLLVVFINH